MNPFHPETRKRSFICGCGILVVTTSYNKERCSPCDKEHQRIYQRDYKRAQRAKKSNGTNKCN